MSAFLAIKRRERQHKLKRHVISGVPDLKFEESGPP